MFEKFMSRKFLTAVLGVITGLAIAAGVDAGEASTVAGAVVSVISVITYIRAESRIDVGRITSAAQAVKDAAEVLTDEDE